jgi:hypothetical protein
MSRYRFRASRFDEGPFSVRLRTAFFAGASALALASLPVAANASVVHPLTTCGYNVDNLQDNSSAIVVEVVPQCAGEAPDSPTIWEYVPISDGNQYIYYSVTTLKNNAVVLTYDCPGTAPDVYHVIYSYGGTFADEFISDDCGTSTEP